MANQKLQDFLPQITAMFDNEFNPDNSALQYFNTDIANETAQYGEDINARFAVPGQVKTMVPGETNPVGDEAEFRTAKIKVNRWNFVDLKVPDNLAAKIEDGSLAVAVRQKAVDLRNGVLKAALLDAFRTASRSVGTPGSTPNKTTIIKAQESLDAAGAPETERFLLLNSADYGTFLGDDAVTAANVRGEVGSAVATGQLRSIYGFNAAKSLFLPAGQTTAAPGAGAITVASNVTAGATELSLAKAAGADWSAVVGDEISIATALGPVTTRIAEAVVVEEGATTTVKVSAPLPALLAGSVVTVTPSHKGSLYMHRSAYGFVARPLGQGAFGAGTVIQTPGDASRIPFRTEVIRQNGQDYVRMDVLWGSGPVRPDCLGVIKS